MAYSYVQYLGDGTTTDFSIPFEYIATSHIQVKVDGVITAFTFPSGSAVRVSPAPANGAVIEVRRVTPRDTKLVDFTDASVLTEADLDTGTDQTLYLSQEVIDIAEGTISLNSLGQMDAQSKRIINVANPVDPGDAVNLGSVQSYVTAAAASASDAAASASDSQNSADDSETYANQAAFLYDSFDDRYLGPKANDPSLDNDNNALVVGTLYWNTAQNVMKAYSGSAWLTAYNPDNSAFPAGTKMLFQQTAAPTGWTKDTTHNDKALRVVSGTASSGGSVAFSTAFGRTATDSFQLLDTHLPGHTHSFSATSSTESQSHTHSGTTLSTNTTGAHQHYASPDTGGGASGRIYDQASILADSQFTPNRMLTSSAGNHSHTISGNTGNASQTHTHTVSGTSGSTGGNTGHSHGIDMRVSYVDVIVATKS